MSDEILFLEMDDILEIHGLQLPRFGGAEGIRDRGLLESAIAQPQAGIDGQFLHSDLFLMAAAYAFHIAENQPFVDGNKRTGLLAALVFLDLNDHSIDQPSDRLYQAIMDIAAHRLDKRGLAELLRELSEDFKE
jgi:death on curing protein